MGVINHPGARAVTSTHEKEVTAEKEPASIEVG